MPRCTGNKKGLYKQKQYVTESITCMNKMTKQKQVSRSED